MPILCTSLVSQSRDDAAMRGQSQCQQPDPAWSELDVKRRHMSAQHSRGREVLMPKRPRYPLTIGEQATAAARANTIMRRAATPAPATSPAKCRSSGCDTNA